MATFDQLSAEQRAIVELVLQRGRSYDELAEMLGMPETRVRELARDALVELAPLSARGVEQDWRGQLADYVLGQQAGPEATATRGHLRRSEAARSWARSLLDSLEQLYPNGSMPAIPDGERGTRRRTGPAAPAPSSAPGAARARDYAAVAGRRRLLALAAGIAGLLLVGVLVWPLGLLSGDDEEPSAAAGSTAGEGSRSASAGGGRANSGSAAGIAIVAEQSGRRSLLVRASNLPTSGQRHAYEVWLYNSQGDARSLGAQVTDAQGQYQAVGVLPRDFSRYRFIDVSREPIDRARAHSGDSVLRGPAPELREATPRGDKAVVLGQTVLTPPRG